MSPYFITIECSYDEFWRYNLAITGAVMVAGKRVEFLSLLDEVAPVCSDLKVAPKDYNRPTTRLITTKEGEELTLYIYIVPHTLPMSRTVDECKHFELHVNIKHGDVTLYNRRHEINQWSGDNIEIKIKE